MTKAAVPLKADGHRPESPSSPVRAVLSPSRDGDSRPKLCEVIARKRPRVLSLSGCHEHVAGQRRWDEPLGRGRGSEESTADSTA